MVEKPNTMSSRKYIHLRIHKFNFFYQLWLNGKPLKLVGEIESWMNVSKANKNLALAICKELYPGHELVLATLVTII